MSGPAVADLPAVSLVAADLKQIRLRLRQLLAGESGDQVIERFPVEYEGRRIR